MISIRQVETLPVYTILYEYPERGAKIALADFPLFQVKGDGFTSGLEALLVMSDLQGREPGWNKPVEERRLLGEVAAEEFNILGELGEIPSPRSIGVILAGDLYVAKDLGRRGGKGDVRNVWRCFRNSFRWVVGVPGNHDRFGEGAVPAEDFLSEPCIYYLDSDVIELDGIRIGGIGGVIGNPSKPFRLEERNFLEALEALVLQNPDIVILHEGPSGRTPDRRGNAEIRKLLEQLPPTLVVCGHCQWTSPEQEELPNGTQILNADGRAYLIRGE